MPLDPTSLFRSPNALARHYSRFRVSERLLLTGHSHQAWPDVGFEAQQQAWLDAAELVDLKWGRAEEMAERVREGWRRLLADPGGDIALGQNTHELVTRLISALPLDRRRRIVATNGEFHTIRRQLDRLAEGLVDVVRVDARPPETLAERLAATVDDSVAAVLVSSVLFETAEIVPNLAVLATACEEHGTTLLLDAYHHLGVVPFDVHGMGVATAFVTGGGYKYCQLGEGNCFLRIPAACTLRPVLTGWYSEFAERDRTGPRGGVEYGIGGARFAGATYDPTSHYRAAAVFDFRAAQGLDATVLRVVSQHQVDVLQCAVEAADLPPAVVRVVDVPAERRAGFLAIRAPRAADICAALRERGVLSDSRGEVLRLGPAPYLSDDQLRDAVARFVDVARLGA